MPHTYSTITGNSSSITTFIAALFIPIWHFLPYKYFKHWHVSIMLKTVSSNQCCKYSNFVDVISYMQQLLHFCPSWERHPSHVALSEVSTCFPLIIVTLVFLYSCWGLRTRDVTPCYVLWDKLWFVNMGHTNTIWLIDWWKKNMFQIFFGVWMTH